VGATVPAAVLAETWHPIVERRQIRIPELPERLDGLSITFLADFHLADSPFATLDLMRKVVERAAELKSEIVALGGDFVRHRPEVIAELCPLLVSLNPRLGIFAVLGNHDHWAGAPLIRQSLTRSGIDCLINQGVNLGARGASIYLCGIDSMWSGRPDVPAAFAARKKQITTVVLLHEPDSADGVAKRYSFDLMLSGHTHGGQVRLPGFRPPVLPVLGKRYVEGLYHLPTAQLYVSRGIGTTGLPVRFCCPPEITRITLRAG
jgi:uncharacterized protein